MMLQVKHDGTVTNASAKDLGLPRGTKLATARKAAGAQDYFVSATTFVLIPARKARKARTVQHVKPVSTGYVKAKIAAAKAAKLA